VVGLGEGDGLGDGEGLGDGLVLGDGLAVGAGLLGDGEVLGLGLVDGVGLAGSLALGDELALGLALAAWLGVAEAEVAGISASPTASARAADSAFFVFVLVVVTAGRWAQTLVALSRLAWAWCAARTPPAPLATISNPAMMLKVGA
jgi:hypothetical protein